MRPKALDAEAAAPSQVPVGTLVSVNVGLPKDVPWQGKTVFTGVYKDPVTGPRRVGKLNVEGDGQGDLAGHGGEQRAVFVYQLDSYHHWERELGRADFRHGQFGENFTIEGLADDEVCIGDRYEIGDALFEVTQPRVTCYRVGIRMNDPRIPALLVSHRRPGFYLRVLREGEVQAGDKINKVASRSGADVRRRGQRAPLPSRSSSPAVAPCAAHPRPQRGLAGLLSRLGRRGRRCWERGPSDDKSAGCLAWLPSTRGHGDPARERDGDLHSPRGSLGDAAAGAPPGSVPDGTPVAWRFEAVSAAELLPLRPPRCRLLPDHCQA